MFNRESLTLLGLDAADNRLLDVLKNGDNSISELSRLTKQPRTSLYPRLERLHARGFVTTTHTGKRRHWKTVSPQKLREKLFLLAHTDETIEESGEHAVGIIPSQHSEYKVYFGLKKLVEIYMEIGQLPRNSRLYGIQPNISAYSLLKKFPYTQLVELNQHIKDRKIIVEGILQENFLEYWSARLKKEKKSPRDLLKAYSGRLAITTYVPAERLNVDSEVMFYSDTVIIANWQELVAVVIKNYQVAGLMMEFFESLKANGQRTDQNPRVAEILHGI